MKLEDFDFELPTDLIALRPKTPRVSARLLVATDNTIDDLIVSDLVNLLRPGDRLVLIIPRSYQRVCLAHVPERLVKKYCNSQNSNKFDRTYR